MLPEKPWKPEAVLQLGASVCFSMLAGMLVLVGLERFCPGLSTSEKNLASYLVEVASLQGAALVWILLFLRGHGVGWREAFGFPSSVEEAGEALFLGGLASFVAWLGTFLLGQASRLVLVGFGITPETQPAIRMLQKTPFAGQLILMGLGTVLLAPIAEEMLFRGILYPTLKRSGHRQLALWASAVLFASIHLNLMAFVPLTFLALVLTWLYEKTGSLLAPIVTHGLFNAMNFMLVILHPPWLKIN